MAAKAKIVKPDNRQILLHACGVATAQKLGVEVVQIKAPGVTECIVVEIDGQQFVGNWTFKAKKPIGWEDGDVKATFHPDGDVTIAEPAEE